MCKRPSLLRRICGITVAALTVAAALLRSFAFATAFDDAVGYFDPGPIPTLLYITVALALGVIAVDAILSVRLAPPPPQDFTHRAPLTCGTAWLVALTLAIYAGYEVVNIFAMGFSPLAILGRLALPLLAIPYFVFKPRPATAWFGIAAFGFCLYSIIIEYFDRYVTMNSPLKLMQQFAALALVLYLLTELNGLARVSQPKRAATYGLLAAFLSITNGISCLIGTFSGRLIPTDYAMRAAVLLALGLYVAARHIPTPTHARSNDTREDV